MSGGTRVLELAAVSRDATPKKGTRSTSTNALEVEQTHSRGWNSTPIPRRTTAARGAAWYGSADIRSAAARETIGGGFRLKRPYPTPLRSEPRSDFPTQPLPSSVPTIDMSAFGGVRGLSRNHTCQICDDYSLATVHCRTLYMYSLLIPIRAFPSEGRSTWVRR
jgi:hypothetical protein